VGTFDDSGAGGSLKWTFLNAEAMERTTVRIIIEKKIVGVKHTILWLIELGDIYKVKEVLIKSRGNRENHTKRRERTKCG